MNERSENGFWYFAHPYTVKDADGNYVPEGEDANFRICCYRTGQLLIRGFNVYSPICHTHPVHRASPAMLGRHEHELWYQLDNEFLERCKWDGIILAPGWTQSTGCLMERDWFMENCPHKRFYSEIIQTVQPVVEGE